MTRLTAFGRALVPDRAIDRPHLRIILVLVPLTVLATTGAAAWSSPVSASVYQYDLAVYDYDADETIVIDRRSPAASTMDPTAEIGRDPAQMPEPAVEAVATSLDLVAPRTARHLCSFSGETEVLMADGTTKPISEIEVGDFVLAEDPETGERGEREVTHLWVHQDMIIDLEIDGHDVATTEDHPFWNDTDGEWQRADALDRGDLLVTAGGATLIVDGMDWGSARTTTAYNLTVDGVHTYFVAVGDEPVLVHNVCFDDVVTTSHGRQRLAEAGFDDLSVDLLRASDTVYEQADGALVHIAQSGPDAFDFIVIGENGIVKAHRGFSRWELDGLAFNHDWLGYP